jgi:hypothetical protein
MSRNSAAPTPLNVAAMVHKPTHSYVHVTPEIAERWLKTNSINRNVRQTKVNQYARDMAAGRWTLSNDDICFDVDGHLLNGQHRLNAVIASGATVLMGIKRNVPRAAMSNMDTGAARTAGDVLGFANEKNAQLLASTVKVLVLIESRRVYQDTKQQGVSHGEIVAWLSSHDDYQDIYEADVRHSVGKASVLRKSVDAPPTSVAVSHYLISQVSGQADADRFFDRIGQPINEPEGSAVHAIRTRLREVQRSRAVYPARNFVYLFIKGWNYYAAGTDVRTLTMAPKAGTRFQIPAPMQWSR